MEHPSAAGTPCYRSATRPRLSGRASLSLILSLALQRLATEIATLVVRADYRIA